MIKKHGYYQGVYRVINQKKYFGKSLSPEYKSLLEYTVFKKLDLDSSIIKWSYEPFCIPYLNRIDKQIHNYFPDIYCEQKINTNGDIKRFLIEIKPSKDLDKNSQCSKKSSELYRKCMYIKNIDKWMAAAAYCKSKNIIFRIITEKDIYK